MLYIYVYICIYIYIIIYIYIYIYIYKADRQSFSQVQLCAAWLKDCRSAGMIL